MARYEDLPEDEIREAREPLVDRVSILEKRIKVLEEAAEVMRRQAERFSRELGI